MASSIPLCSECNEPHESVAAWLAFAASCRDSLPSATPCFADWVAQQPLNYEFFSFSGSPEEICFVSDNLEGEHHVFWRVRGHANLLLVLTARSVHVSCVVSPSGHRWFLSRRMPGAGGSSLLKVTFSRGAKFSQVGLISAPLSRESLMVATKHLVGTNGPNTVGLFAQALFPMVDRVNRGMYASGYCCMCDRLTDACTQCSAVPPCSRMFSGTFL